MIKYAPLDANKLLNLLKDLEENIRELKKLDALGEKKFVSSKKNYGLADHYLRRTLEGILTIGTHILSRLPAKTKDYQEIVVSLGEQGIVPKTFARRNKKLAGYRNRLVHMYWEVSREEMYTVIHDHLLDLEKFHSYFNAVLKNPKKFNIEAE